MVVRNGIIKELFVRNRCIIYLTLWEIRCENALCLFQVDNPVYCYNARAFGFKVKLGNQVKCEPTGNIYLCVNRRIDFRPYIDSFCSGLLCLCVFQGRKKKTVFHLKSYANK